MRTLIFLMIWLFVGTNLKAQRNYPIKTMFKGDSVVMLTVQQSEAFNKFVETQRSTIETMKDERDLNLRSIKSLRDTVSALKKKMLIQNQIWTGKYNELNKRSILLDSSLVFSREETELYKEKLKQTIANIRLMEKKERRQMFLGIGGTLAVWVSLVVFSLKN